MSVGFSPVPSWQVPGIVGEVRELSTKDGKRVWAHSIKIVAMGGTFEMQTPDEAVAKQFGSGQQVVASGRFETFQGALKLIVTGVKPLA